MVLSPGFLELPAPTIRLSLAPVLLLTLFSVPNSASTSIYEPAFFQIAVKSLGIMPRLPFFRYLSAVSTTEGRHSSALTSCHSPVVGS